MPLVSVVMGSKSDYDVMKDAVDLLRSFGIETEYSIVSAHRTPQLMYEYSQKASGRGVEVIVAGAGGAAHLPGMVASLTELPVIGVPVPSKHMQGLDSLLSIVQMPAGIPVATVAIGNAKNAALLAARILAIKHKDVKDKLVKYMEKQTADVLSMELP